jgi:hypothetical protein
MSAADRILEKSQGKSFEQTEVENASENMFWWMTLVNIFLYVAIAAWKFFFFIDITISSHRWSLFLQLTAAGAPEAFRMASLIMAHYEAKQKRRVTVWFGITISIAIMGYDIYTGRHLPSQAYESFVFLCILSELIGIRAVFGRAFEESFVTKESFVTTKEQPATEIKIPEPIQEKPAPTVNLRASKSVPAKKGKPKPMTEGQINAKIKEYQWKLDNSKGKPETNSKNISKLQEALNQFNK